MDYLVSVIVPVYNVEPYLPRCIDSILAQTYPNWELILIDDGSTDLSGKICDEYAAENSKIQVIHQRNQGVSVARNAGMEVASGDYFLFVDPDDWLSEVMLEEMLKAGKGAALIACGYTNVYCYEDGTEKREVNCIWKDHSEAFETTEPYYDLLVKTATLWNKLFRRDVVENLRFVPGLRYGEDALFAAQALRSVSSAVLIPHPYYFYFKNRQGNVVSAPIDERALEHLDCTFLIYSELRAAGEGVCGIQRIRIGIDSVLEKFPYPVRHEHRQFIRKIGQVLRKTDVRDRLRYVLDKRFGLSRKGKAAFFLLQYSPEFYLFYTRRKASKKPRPDG